AQDEASEGQGDRARREHDEELRSDDRPDHREEQQRRQAARCIADGTAAAKLQAVHHQIRDDQQRHGALHVDGKSQERRAEGGESEADRALDEGGEQRGGDRSENYRESDSCRTSAGCLARRPARCWICWRQETPGATISVSAAAALTAGASRRLPSATEMS